MRVVGIDFGLARIGVAISDPMKIVATAHSVCDAKKGPQGLLDHLKGYMGEIELFVVGLPLKLSGEAGDMANKAKAFAEDLKKLSGLPIHLWDERLSSAQVEKEFKAAGYNRKKRAQKSDAAAAVVILQSYLDQLF